MRFRNRVEAGRRLAAALAGYKRENPLILALPRGGVPVAAEVATQFDAPMDIILVRKIGAPMQPELALGAVVDGGEPIVVRNPYVIESTATSEEEFRQLCQAEIAEIERRRARFLGKRAPLDPQGRVVIVVDDGIATGATMRAALQATRARRPRKLVLAVPVAPSDTLESLRGEVDEVVCLTNLGPIRAIGYYYDDFRQLTDADVIDVLSRFFAPPARHAESAMVGADALRKIAGDLDDTKAAEILALRPSESELEQAVMSASGTGDVLAKEGRVLDGKAAQIFDILTADAEDEPVR